MRKVLVSLCIVLLVLLLCLLGAIWHLERQILQEQLPVVTETVMPETEATQTTQASEEATTEAATEPPTEAVTEAPTEVVYVYDFTPEEEQLLLKLGMAERGNIHCSQCVALVMRTVLNRVEGPKFSSTIRGVIYAKDQFTPAMDGTLETAEPNDLCYTALEMVKQGWDESQGALYYEWCEGESWHSQNLNLLTQHCDTRFYN